MTSIKPMPDRLSCTGKLHPLFSISTQDSNRLLFQISKAAKVKQCSSASVRRNSEGVSVLSRSLGHDKDQLTETRTTSCHLMVPAQLIKEVVDAGFRGCYSPVSNCPSENKGLRRLPVISLKAKSS